MGPSRLRQLWPIVAGKPFLRRLNLAEGTGDKNFGKKALALFAALPLE
jgi:hypothetical protein